ncbi:MAG: ParA family protein [Acidobacteria bacterium]|nr:ParA family protein [Acidobacteriota bacterium]
MSKGAGRTDADRDRPLGRIITFYSYKGGTGRSMAVANVAWVLALNGYRVLVIDWDLEAPGIHRYFHPFLADKELLSTEPARHGRGAGRRGGNRVGAAGPNRRGGHHQLRRAAGVASTFDSYAELETFRSSCGHRPDGRRPSGSVLFGEAEHVQLDRLLRAPRRQGVAPGRQAADAGDVRLHADRQPDRYERYVRHLYDRDAGHARDLLHAERAEHSGRRRSCRVGTGAAGGSLPVVGGKRRGANPPVPCPDACGDDE